MNATLPVDPNRLPEPWLSSPVELALVLLLSALVTLPWLGTRDLWTSGEARVPQVARQMVQPLEINRRINPHGPSGRITRLIVPYIGDELRLEKPPLAYWLIVASSLTTGGEINEFSARLPSALAAILLSLLLAVWGRQLLGGTGGLLSGVAMAFTLSCWWQARNSTIESHHLLFFTTAFYCWWRSFTCPEVRSLHSRLWMAGCYAQLGLAILDKGPIAPIVLFLIICIYHLCQRRNPFALDLKAHLPGLGILLLITLPWTVAVVIATQSEVASPVLHCPKLLSHLFATGADGLPETRFPAIAEWIKQFFGRMEGFDHIKPFHYFFTKILGDGQPWVFFSLIGMALILARRRITQNAPKDRANLLPVWFIVSMVFFSIPASKKSYYILPVYPALALSAAWLFEALRNGELKGSLTEKAVLKLVTLFGVLCVILGPAILFLSGVIEDSLPQYQNLPLHFSLAALLCLLSGWLLIYATLRKNPLAIFSVLTLATLLSLAIHTSLIPVLNTHKGDRLFCQGLEEMTTITDQDSILTYDMSNQPVFRYYLNRHVDKLNTPECLLTILESKAEGTRILLGMANSDFQAVTLFTGTTEEQYQFLLSALLELQKASPDKEVSWYNPAKSSQDAWRVILDARPHMPKKERLRNNLLLEEQILRYARQTESICASLQAKGGRFFPLHQLFDEIHPAHGTDCLWLIAGDSQKNKEIW